MKLGFTYMYTNDLAKAKHFYEALLGLQLIWDIEDSLAFQIEDHQLSIQLDTTLETLSPEFCLQPGWEGYWSFPVLDPMMQTIEITATD